ncbi:MAG: hypothetical protein ACK5XZ_13575 [Hyphomonadaceae bacterium]|jgi:hypothetical protein
MNAETPVELIAPSFRLQRKMGGPASRMLTPEAYRKANAALEEIIPPIDDEARRLLQELQDALQAMLPGGRDIMWNNAHEIRGLAGTVRKDTLGQAANLICHYLNDTASDFIPDQGVMQTIVVVAHQALREDADTDPMIKVLVQDGARAVLAQRHREGRD